MVLPSSKLCIASMNAEVKAPGQGRYLMTNAFFLLTLPFHPNCLILPSRLLVYKATLRLML